MNCPTCQTENPDAAKFCNNCGAQLETTSDALETPAPVEKPKKRPRWLLIVGAVVALCVIGAIFAALLAPGEDATPTPSAVAQATQPAEATEAEQPTEAPAPSDTPLPTDTSLPTDTPVPTDTPIPTDAPIPTNTPIPTDTPTPTPEPTPIVLSGTGQYVTDEFVPPTSISVAYFTHTGSSNFVVKVYQGDDEDLLINEIGPYRGSRPILGEPTILAVDADGAWTVEVKPMWTADTSAFSGKGDAVSGIFEPPARGAWNISHDGESNFVVYFHCAGGSDLVQNEIGSVSGSIMVVFPDGPCFWEVEADGNWSLAPRD